MKSGKRLEDNDLPLLKQWRKKHPQDHRIAFYLAQTLLTMHRWKDALGAYADRIALGGYHVRFPCWRMQTAACCWAVAAVVAVGLHQHLESASMRCHPSGTGC